MAQRKRQVLFTESRRDRHAARQILRCFCRCAIEDLTRISTGWLAGEDSISRHPRNVMDVCPKNRKMAWCTGRVLPGKHAPIRKEAISDN